MSGGYVSPSKNVGSNSFVNNGPVFGTPSGNYMTPPGSSRNSTPINGGTSPLKSTIRPGVNNTTGRFMPIATKTRPQNNVPLQPGDLVSDPYFPSYILNKSSSDLKTSNVGDLSFSGDDGGQQENEDSGRENGFITPHPPTPDADQYNDNNFERPPRGDAREEDEEVFHDANSKRGVEEFDNATDDAMDDGFDTRSIGLYKRLNDIIVERPGDLIYDLLANDCANVDAYDNDQLTYAIVTLKRYQRICNEYVFIEESEYLDKIICILRAKFRKEKLERGVTFDSSMRVTIQQLQSEFQHELRQIQRDENEAINEELNDYDRRCQSLDEKYQNQRYLQKLFKPSFQLQNERLRLKKLLGTRAYAAAKNLKKIIIDLEEQEILQNQRLIQDKYYFEDRALKEEYAQRLRVIRSRYDLKREKLQQKFEYNLRLHDLNLSKVTGAKERSYSGDVSKLIRDLRKEAEDPIDIDLYLRAPRKLDRALDFEIVREMAEQLRASKTFSVEKAFTQSLRLSRTRSKFSGNSSPVI